MNVGQAVPASLVLERNWQAQPALPLLELALSCPAAWFGVPALAGRHSLYVRELTGGRLKAGLRTNRNRASRQTRPVRASPPLAEDARRGGDPTSGRARVPSVGTLTAPAPSSIWRPCRHQGGF